jgi:hypothetical protein
MRIALLVLMAVMGFTSCRRLGAHTTSSAAVTLPDTLVSGIFITAPGEYRGHEKNFTRSVKLTAVGNSIAWAITTVKGSSGSSEDSHTTTSALVLSKPADPWFIHVESPSRLWLCDGHSNLYACFISGKGTNEHHQLVNSGHRTTKDKPLPAEVYHRLPEALRALFPAPAEPERRPSF